MVADGVQWGTEVAVKMFKAQHGLEKVIQALMKEVRQAQQSLFALLLTTSAGQDSQPTSASECCSLYRSVCENTVLVTNEHLLELDGRNYIYNLSYLFIQFFYSCGICIDEFS